MTALDAGPWWPIGRLPGGWTARAACRTADPEMFFPDKGDPKTAAAAKRFCARCPVVSECLEFGMGEHMGVWGGLTARERERLRRVRSYRRAS